MVIIKNWLNLMLTSIHIRYNAQVHCQDEFWGEGHQMLPQQRPLFGLMISTDQPAGQSSDKSCHCAGSLVTVLKNFNLFNYYNLLGGRAHDSHLTDDKSKD